MQTAESIAVNSLLSLPHASSSDEVCVGKQASSDDPILAALEQLNRMAEGMKEVQEQLKHDVLDHRRAVLHGVGQNRDIAIGTVLCIIMVSFDLRDIR